MENQKEFYPLQLVNTKVSNTEIILSKERYIALLANSLGFTINYANTQSFNLTIPIANKLKELSSYEVFESDKEYLDHITVSLQSISELLELIRNPDGIYKQ